MPTIAEILAAGVTVDIDPLIAVPTSLDPATGQKPPWPDYRQFSGVVNPVNQLPGGLTFTISTVLQSTALVWEIVALGVSYQGSVLFAATLAPSIYVRQDAGSPVQINGQVNPVQS